MERIKKYNFFINEGLFSKRKVKNQDDDIQEMEEIVETMTLSELKKVVIDKISKIDSYRLLTRILNELPEEEDLDK